MVLLVNILYTFAIFVYTQINIPKIGLALKVSQVFNDRVNGR